MMAHPLSLHGPTEIRAQEGTWVLCINIPQCMAKLEVQATDVLNRTGCSVCGKNCLCGVCVKIF